jgi:predicted DNA-binding transcriptional regulator YafY
MRRADRLLRLVQLLRRQRRPITAKQISESLEVARRTVYRDIADLQASQVPIEGAAGLGYVLKPGYDLPPLMFSSDEIEAIVLGMRLVKDRGDLPLSHAAADVLAKIATVLPKSRTREMDRTNFFVPVRPVDEAGFGPYLPMLRKATQQSEKLRISYADAKDQVTRRTIWPLALIFYTHATSVCTWCELRQDFRMLRADRIKALENTGENPIFVT